MKYVLTLSPEQARAVQSALDLYMRVGIGQLKTVAEVWGDIGTRENGETEASDEAEHLFAVGCEALTGFPSNSSWSIANRDKVHIKARRAYEVDGMLRQQIARVEKHGDHSVWHHDPLSLTGEAFPTVSVTGEDKDG